MKKGYYFLSLLGLLVLACSAPEDESNISKTIDIKKKELATLQTEIEELEKQLPASELKSDPTLVNVQSIKPSDFKHYFTVYGEVEAVKYAKVSPEIGGKIEKIHVNQGDYVSKGQLLVSLNNTSIKGNIKQLKSQLDLAKVTFEKQQKLWDQKIGSEIQYLQAKTQVESLEAQLSSIQSQAQMNEVRAPFSGYVNEIYLKQGELAGGIMPTLEMVDLSRLKVEADVSEKYMGQLKKGQRVELSFEAFPDLKLEIPIKAVSKVLSNQSRTFQVELEFSNKAEKIKPNMLSKVIITDFESDTAIVIPSLIIKEDVKGKYVFVALKNKAQKKYVQTGLSVDNQTMITKGLQFGDNVITDGFNLVSSGSEVTTK